ncbi:MAG: IS30 family transposase [Fastidiosipilaceae bacterium]
MATFTHLSSIEREQIYTWLNQGKKVTYIASKLNRDPKTIAAEIKRNRFQVFKGSYNAAKNNCAFAHNRSCKRRGVCPTCSSPNRPCALCGKCTAHCSAYEEAQCKRLVRSPHCCNGCKSLKNCSILRYEYSPSVAQDRADKRLRESRLGLGLGQDELDYITELFKDGIKKGQSVHHVYASRRSEMICSERQVYKLIESQQIDIQNIDMPRVVQRKYKNRRKSSFKVDRLCHVGRSYRDYQDYLVAHPDLLPVQMDCVEGIKEDRKCLLSFSWPHLQFYLIYVLERQTAACVAQVFDNLHQRLGDALFRAFFQLVLTDRGSEFSDPAVLEAGGRTKIFYCDAMASYQKGHVENGNGIVRRIIPKGYSLQRMTSEDCHLVNSHLNSYVRASINNKTPWDLVATLYGNELLHKLSLKKIPAQDVLLRPALLKGVLVKKTYG